MADQFFDLYLLKRQGQSGIQPKTDTTSDIHNNNTSYNSHNTNNTNIWDYCNLEGTYTTQSPITPLSDTNMFDAIEDLMVPDFFHNRVLGETANSQAINIWDLINDSGDGLDSIKEEQDDAMSYVKDEDSDVSYQPRKEDVGAVTESKPIDYPAEHRFKNLQPSKRKYDLLSPPPQGAYCSVLPPPSNPISFKASSPLDRKRSISKMPLNELYEVMGLPHDHQLALEREEQIMGILERHGFEVGEKTWIRDTEEPARRCILEAVYTETFPHYGYSKRLLEAIIRRGTYARMQSNLRRRRRRRRRIAASQI